MRRREDHRFTQKHPQISFISDGVKTLVMIKKCIRFVLLHSWESGRWWACEYLMATTALSMHYSLKDKPVFICCFFFLCVDSKQLSEASLHPSLVSHFSGCHISSWNMTSAVRNVAVRLRPTSSCSFCPVCSRLES